MSRVLVVDNYDSFTWNLVHLIGPLVRSIEVVRNDETTTEAVLALEPDAIVLSPGPCTPAEAGICLDLARQATARVPMLGVCLGHQTIGQAFGGAVVPAPFPVHGRVGEVHHRGAALLAGLPSPFHATRSHSLVVRREDLPPELEATAWTEDGLIMGLAHRTLPVWGVQFHPESIASAHGHDLLRNVLKLAGLRAAGQPSMPAAAD